MPECVQQRKQRIKQIASMHSIENAENKVASLQESLLLGRKKGNQKNQEIQQIREESKQFNCKKASTKKALTEAS